MPLPRQSAAAATCACLIVSATAAHARTHIDTASFYSSGRVTASGEKFDRTALKAAHRTLPFGSIVKVIDRRSGKSVVVEINDRGPAKWTRRTIDLTREAGRRIGMVRRGVVPVRLEVSRLTRPQLDHAFQKLMVVADAKAASAALEARAELPPPTAPAPLQIASAVATEITRPVQALGNIFKTYVENLIVPASDRVRLTCPDGKPLPEALRAVLRRAAWDFDHEVEVVSGFRSLAYNRGVYGNHCRRGRCRGDG